MKENHLTEVIKTFVNDLGTRLSVQATIHVVSAALKGSVSGSDALSEEVFPATWAQMPPTNTTCTSHIMTPVFCEHLEDTTCHMRLWQMLPTPGPENRFSNLTALL